MPTKRTPKQVSRVPHDPAPRRPLAGTIAVVAGATRGAGRGIARALGEAGATVYCTGRSVRGRPSPYNRPETIARRAESAEQRPDAFLFLHGIGWPRGRNAALLPLEDGSDGRR